MPPCCIDVVNMPRQHTCWHTVMVCWGRMSLTTVDVLVDNMHTRVTGTWKKSHNIADLLKTSSTFCVRFSRHELPCVPEHLQYETYRTQTLEDRTMRRTWNDWMDLVVIDCQPFSVADSGFDLRGGVDFVNGGGGRT